ncbi:MAG: GNAT family protein [Phormidesmis sp.]
MNPPTNEIVLRPTQLAELPFILTAEQHPENVACLGQWSQTQHQAALADADTAHLIATSAGRPVGYVILTGLENPHRAINLRRIVVTEKRQGYGRQIVRWVKAFAFDTLDCHCLWLDVVASNQRAKPLYESEGFVIEGILRDRWKTADGYEPMLMMSLLKAEFRAASA